jgi:hypothetical protein
VADAERVRKLKSMFLASSDSGLVHSRLLEDLSARLLWSRCVRGHLSQVPYPSTHAQRVRQAEIHVVLKGLHSTLCEDFIELMCSLVI